jgi:hypothetical protein
MRFALAAFLLLMSAGLVTAQTTKPAEIPTSGKDRKIHPATQPGQVLELTIPELGNFDFDADAKDPKIPDDVKDLSGVTIRLHGVMVPIDQADYITKFALVPTLQGWSHLPSIQQTIVVTCPPGKSVEYCPDEIVVQGKLTVAILKDDGFIVGIFAVDGASTRPATKESQTSR